MLHLQVQHLPPEARTSLIVYGFEFTWTLAGALIAPAFFGRRIVHKECLGVTKDE
jgi:hypothetical protein